MGSNMGNRTKTVKTLGVMKGGSQANILHPLLIQLKTLNTITTAIKVSCPTTVIQIIN